MKVTELIGKTSLRNKPVVCPNGVIDRSYCGGQPVKILHVTANHFAILSGFHTKSYLESILWDDGEWEEVPPLK